MRCGFRAARVNEIIRQHLTAMSLMAVIGDIHTTTSGSAAKGLRRIENYLLSVFRFSWRYTSVASRDLDERTRLDALLSAFRPHGKSGKPLRGDGRSKYRMFFSFFSCHFSGRRYVYSSVAS